MSEVAGSNPLPRSSFSPKRARLPVPRPRSCDSDIDRTKARDKVLIMLLFKRGCNTKANGSTFCHSITRMGNISLISLRQSGMGLIHPGCYLLAVAGTLLVLSGGDSGDWGDEGLTALTCNPCMCLAERQAHPSPLRLLHASVHPSESGEVERRSAPCTQALWPLAATAWLSWQAVIGRMDYWQSDDSFGHTYK